MSYFFFIPFNALTRNYIEIEIMDDFVGQTLGVKTMVYFMSNVRFFLLLVHENMISFSYFMGLNFREI